MQAIHKYIIFHCITGDVLSLKELNNKIKILKVISVFGALHVTNQDKSLTRFETVKMLKTCLIW